MELFDKTSGFKKYDHDVEIEREIVDHCRNFLLEPLDAIKHFAVLSRRQQLKRFLAHVELFKMTLDVPGDIAEVGVYRGSGLMTWANLLEIFCIGDRTKTVFGFDNWQGFSDFNFEDGEQNESAGKVLGGFDPSDFRDELESAIRIFDKDRFVSWKPRVRLIDGHAEVSIPKFVSENPGRRFSLVHFDCDLYKPTKLAFEALLPMVSRGGIIIFDEYAIADWPGETKAVDDVLTLNKELKLKTFSWSNVPGAYLIKT
jgi:hypothetical protein